MGGGCLRWVCCGGGGLLIGLRLWVVFVVVEGCLVAAPGILSRVFLFHFENFRVISVYFGCFGMFR